MIKQEAINWIKKLHKPIKEFETIPLVHHEEMKSFHKTGEFNSILTENINQINWIKHFFNITEEDFK